eukprot:767006-Rhodomonas_salina.1
MQGESSVSVYSAMVLRCSEVGGVVSSEVGWWHGVAMYLDRGTVVVLRWLLDDDGTKIADATTATTMMMMMTIPAPMYPVLALSR